jgi:hypothetical protein
MDDGVGLDARNDAVHALDIAQVDVAAIIGEWNAWPATNQCAAHKPAATGEQELHRDQPNSASRTPAITRSTSVSARRFPGGE